MTAWIELTEFADRYGVSMSTLRRRIRARQIAFRMEKGKYLVQDSSDTIESAPLYARLGRATVAQSAGVSADAKLVEENRRLRAQIAELETLVKVLEGELRATE